MTLFARHALGQDVWVETGRDAFGKPAADMVKVDAVVFKPAGTFYEVHAYGYTLVVPERDVYASWDEFWERRLEPLRET